MPAATRRSLVPLAVVTAAAFLFALLLLLVRLHWAPLESADHGAAARLNSLVAGHSAVVSTVKAVTWLVMAGELAAFLVVAAIVKRPRPDVPNLDAHLPTSAFPSGHMAATTCLYAGIAILVTGHARGWWRYLFGVPAVVMPVMIATARMYRGEHHPTDILASVLFAGLWLTATTMLVKPNQDGLDRASRRPLGLARRKAADHSRETVRQPEQAARKG